MIIIVIDFKSHNESNFNISTMKEINDSVDNMLKSCDDSLNYLDSLKNKLECLEYKKLKNFPNFYETKLNDMEQKYETVLYKNKSLFESKRSK